MELIKSLKCSFEEVEAMYLRNKNALIVAVCGGRRVNDLPRMFGFMDGTQVKIKVNPDTKDIYFVEEKFRCIENMIENFEVFVFENKEVSEKCTSVNILKLWNSFPTSVTKLILKRSCGV
ncbi:MAG: hypothetical protein ACRC92_27325 [Peptostreptococcaceae bacterium]